MGQDDENEKTATTSGGDGNKGKGDGSNADCLGRDNADDMKESSDASSLKVDVSLDVAYVPEGVVGRSNQHEKKK